MGYYTCPKCGSNESFEGTEMVSEYKPGVTHYIENAAGQGIARQTGGKTKHTSVTVTKCKACGELLGKKDFRLTRKEIAANKKKEEQEKQKGIEKKFVSKQSTLLGFAIIFAIVAIATSYDRDDQFQWLPPLLFAGGSITSAFAYIKRKNQHQLDKYIESKTP